MSLLLLASLLAFSAAWASGEEIREQGTKSESSEEKDDGGPGSAAAGDDRSADDETDDETGDETPASAPTDPSFNTIEDILVCLDLPEALEAPRALPASAVVWREVLPRPAGAR